MGNVANASIKAFGQSPKADFVPPSEESVFVLTSSQLSALITAAVEKAIQPLQDHIESLESTVTGQDAKLAALEATQDTQADNSLIQLRLIGQLREAAKREAQPLQRDRGEILRALIAANGGKMLAKDARQKMHLEPWTFSKLLDTMRDFIETRPYRLKGNQKLLVLRSNLIARNTQQD